MQVSDSTPECGTSSWSLSPEKIAGKAIGTTTPQSTELQLSAAANVISRRTANVTLSGLRDAVHKDMQRQSMGSQPRQADLLQQNGVNRPAHRLSRSSVDRVRAAPSPIVESDGADGVVSPAMPAAVSKMSRAPSLPSPSPPPVTYVPQSLRNGASSTAAAAAAAASLLCSNSGPGRNLRCTEDSSIRRDSEFKPDVASHTETLQT